MVIKKVYDSRKRVQRAWHDSSMIAYSEMYEHSDENKGDLYITFNNGQSYLYRNVALEDYVVFIGGGTDMSDGKTFFKVIKPKYECEKVSSLPARSDVFDSSDAKVFFISGHRDLTEDEFRKYYTVAINAVVETWPDASFVVGDYHGCDIMAQNYLLDELGIAPEKVCVYHMGTAPKNVNPGVTVLKGGFEDDESRDAAMTAASYADIAYVRKGRFDSGTAQNILRRHLLGGF